MSGTSRKHSFPRVEAGVPLPPVVGFCVQTLNNNPSRRKGLTDRRREGLKEKKMTGMTALNFNDFDKYFIGFNRLHDELARRVDQNPLTNYPRYNLVAVGQEAYRIEMALPGWNRDNIEIKQHKNKLTIEGIEKQELEANEKYVHKGLSGKTFSRVFTLGDWVEVGDAGFKNGMLVINLQVNTPEEEKPKTIEIG